MDRIRTQQPILCGTTITYPINLSPQCTLERALKGISSTGLRYVELAAVRGYCEHIPLGTTGVLEVAQLKALLEHYDLTPIALNASTDLTQDSGLRDLENASRFAQLMGIKTVVTAIQETETEDGLSRFLDHIPAIEKILANHDIMLALETHRGYLSTGLRGVALLKRINSQRLKINYDMTNVYNRGGVVPEEDLLAMGKAVGEYIGHVHLKDKANWTIGERTFPIFGTGVLNFGRVLSLLWEGGYRGPMTLEVEFDGKGGPQVLDEALNASYRYLKQFWLSDDTHEI